MTMKSIAAQWRWQAAAEEKTGASQERQPDPRPERWKGDDGIPLGEKPQVGLNPEELLLVREMLGRIVRQFAGDQAARELIAGWDLGLNAPELQARSGLTHNQLRAAVRRVRRFVWRGGEVVGD